MTRKEKILLENSMRWLEYSIKNNKSMVFIGYNDEGKQVMSYLGNSNELVNLVAREMVHICKDCECPIDEVIDAVRKYMEKWEEEENEVRD